VNENYVNDAQRLQGFWHCLDETQDIDLYGFYDAGAAQFMRINLKKCDSVSNVCQEEESAGRSLGDKFIAVLHNERNYD